MTSGNCYYGPFLPKLIEDLEADCVSADAGYCSKLNVKVVREMGVVPGIADYPRKKGKSHKIEPSEFLKKRSYVIEQFNGHVKENVLDGAGLCQGG